MNLGTVDDCIDAFPAYLETDRSFDTTVCEVKVAKFVLSLVAVNENGKADVFQLVTAQCFSCFSKWHASVDMALL